MIDQICGRRMYSYDHWACKLPPRHGGRHRFNNYTAGRFPRFWRVRQLYRFWKTNRKLRCAFLDERGYPVVKGGTLRYGQVLWPNRYDPVR